MKLIATLVPLVCVLAAPLCLVVYAKEPASQVSDAHIDEALKASGDHCEALQAVLDHFTKKGDPEMLEGARFLIANMPGHGYTTTVLRDKEKNEVAFDPLTYKTFKESRGALEALEKEHGELEFDRAKHLLDVKTISASFLVNHVEAAFKAWRNSPDARRVDLNTFLNFVLPYRGSQEPLDDWLSPLMQRYADLESTLAKEPLNKSESKAPPTIEQRLYRRLGKDIHKRVRFNERFYLHPTDQGFGEMEKSGQGRCEDITNMITFAARSQALATAADYTPAWAHRDNNHAWNVLLNREGRGSAKSNAHAAKIYRKTFALQRDNLIFRLANKKLAPSRFMASKTYIDVTDQYAPVTDVTVKIDDETHVARTFAYLCVFNGGKWTPIHWGEIKSGQVNFTKMGRDICYLPATYDGTSLIPFAPPLIVHRNGTVRHLGATGYPSEVYLQGTHPKRVSPDTHVVTPKSSLKPGMSYTLNAWREGAWKPLRSFVAGENTERATDLVQDGLFWLVQKDSRKLERIFTLQDGLQRWW